MMADSQQDTFDDLSFYIGDQEDGFCTSESVYDSDISETDSEADDDDCDWLLDDESDDQCVDEIIGETLKIDDSEQDTCDDISYFCIGDEEEGFCTSESVYDSDISETDSEADYDDDDDWLLDNECGNKSVDESVVTGLTMACSDMDSLEDASFYICKEEGFCISENAYDSDISEIHSCDDDNDCNDSLLVRCEKEEVSYTPKRREADTLDTILYHPLYLSAILTILAHRSTQSDSRVFKTLPCSYSQEEMPIIDALTNVL
mmetsp:Transcript_38041/g.62171  ORF Transcript_38041/g.62171 Transcript_38041/m.62171 type:complete len:261 (-) Transcript_38041:24-806(-)